MPFSGNSIISILDLNTNEPYTSTISNVFQRYMGSNFNIDDYSQLQLPFGANNIMIKDWTGWTSLLTLRSVRIDPDEDKWYNVKVGNNVLDLTYKTPLPLWNRNEVVRGFHGEMKYRFLGSAIKFFDKEQTYYGRALGLLDEKDEPYTFAPYEVAPIDFIPYGFEIQTSSGYANISNILFPVHGVNPETDAKIFMPGIK